VFNLFNKKGENMNLIIGSHVGFTKDEQLLGSVKEALKYGENTFMFYTGAPQNTNRIPIDSTLTKEAWNMMKENGIDINNVIVHAPYIINLGNTDKIDSYHFATNFLAQEIKRCEELGMNKLVLHPGSFVTTSRESGIKSISDALNQVINKDTKVMVLLETMAGKGSEVGCTFEDLKGIIDSLNYPDKVGICMDTCHLNDAGYDVTNFDKVLDEFDEIVGIDKIKCIHVNDSKNDFGAHKDRHANIGFGTIGFDNLIKIIYNERLSGVPKILETPYVGDYAPYKLEIQMIRDKKFNPNLLEDVKNV
jgi:deoxyribonuclease-4